MRRFFIETCLDNEMSIQGSDAHHISKVLRLEIGDRIVVVSSTGDAAIAKITNIALDAVTLLLEERIEEEKEAPINVYVAQGLPKSDKMDYVVQKVVELGVKGIYPMEAQHCVVQYDQAKKKSRQERWQKIALEAAKQCGRAMIPIIEPIASLATILQSLPADTVVLMLYEGQASQGLGKALREHKAKNYLLLVGPEGGFSNKEVELCRDHGAFIVTMGPRILRTETAAVAGVSIVMYEYGDLGG